MRRLVRTSIYALLLLVVGGYGTYRVYVNPDQVRARLEAELERLVTRDVTASGCALDIIGSLRAREIVIPASPLIDARSIVTLGDVEVQSSAGGRPFRFRRVASAVAAPPYTIRVAEGVLRLDHEALGSPRDGVERWSFSDLLRLQAILDNLERSAGQVLLDRLDVHLQDFHPPRAKLAIRFAARDVEARWSKSSEVTLGAELDECDLWSGGYIELRWSPSRGLQAKGQIDELRDASALATLLGPLGQAWQVLTLRGVVGVDLEEVRWPNEGPLSLRGVVQHYDTAIEDASLGLTIKGLRGAMRVNESGWSLGQEGDPPAHAEVMGSPVAVSGTCRAGKWNLGLTLEPSRLDTVLPALLGDHRSAWAVLAEVVRPRGRIEGVVEVVGEPDRLAQISGELRFGEVHLQGLPFISGAAGTLNLPLAAPASGSAHGRANLNIEALEAPGLGAGSGTMQVSWDDGGARVDFLDLKFGPAGAAGSIFASSEWGNDGLLKSLEGRGVSLRLRTALLEVDELGGNLKSTGSVAPAAERLAEGSLKIGAGRTPAGRLWAESPEIHWRRGEASLSIHGGPRRRVVISGLCLAGDSHVLRTQGDLGLDGALDLVLLVADGADRQALEGLPAVCSPATWRAAAGAGFRAFRVSGTLSEPRLREISALDAAFVESDRPSAATPPK